MGNGWIRLFLGCKVLLAPSEQTTWNDILSVLFFTAPTARRLGTTFSTTIGR